jgi:hypothetical protein
MKKVIIILSGLFGVLVGAGFILPALAKVRDYGLMPGGVVVHYTLGIVITLGGLGLALYGVMRRAARRA